MTADQIHMSTSATARPYDELTPEMVLDAVESTGAIVDGRFLALNSYENRVYQVGIENGTPLVAKFYRPNRWSVEAILEEHRFSWDLANREIPVVAPLADEQGETLHNFGGFQFAVFPRRGGRSPELDPPENLRWLGRFLGRIHAVGAVETFQHRPVLNSQTFGVASYEFLLNGGFIPRDWQKPYRDVAEAVLEQINNIYANLERVRLIRLHGDCHPGNILWTDEGPHFVDLDDCRMGPAIQDLWMLLSGTQEEMGMQLGHILDGYTEFFDFNWSERNLVEALRTLRIMHYSAWLAKRWEDPAFPKHFPWFGEPRYWESQIAILHEQSQRLDAPPLI